MTYDRKTIDMVREQIRRWYYDIGTPAGDYVVAVLDDLDAAEAKIAELEAEVERLQAQALAEGRRWALGVLWDVSILAEFGDIDGISQEVIPDKALEKLALRVERGEWLPPPSPAPPEGGQP